ncbi:MAG TPA: ABC transporter ATP-binding protein [Dongiaceae bacterium]|jgi:branched-chain amino acid transport system ATP-binding protein|nr:ABC transporter ATP-binding protein [Dongiaceae bacterium]
MDGQPTLLRLDGVGKRFGGLPVLSGLDVAVGEGNIHSLIGPNGAGKTTVFNCIMSLLPIDTGRILLGETRIDGLRPHLVARHGVARTYQNIRLFPDMTIMENVLVGMHRLLGQTILAGMLSLPGYRREEARWRDEARQLLSFIGLGGDPDRPVRGLSYGDQRRVEIARALASKPRLLLLDEPAAGMNPAEGAQLVDLIRRIRDRYRVTVMLVEHHMRIVMSISDIVTVLDRGRVLASDVPDSIRNDSKVIDAYLGRAASKLVEENHERRVEA